MKFQQESKELEGIQVEKSDFDAFATFTNQSYMVHGVGKLDKGKRFDTMVISVDRDKAISFAALIPSIDFIIPDKFNDIVHEI